MPRNVLSLLAWRFVRARKLRSALSAVSVALGVALMAALLTLNASMSRALDLQLAKMFGTFDLMVGYRTADTRFSHADLEEIRQTAGVTEVAGLLIPYMYEHHEGLHRDLPYYGAPDTPLGRQFMAVEQGSFPGPGEVAISSAWAKREAYKLGDTIKLAFPPNGEKEVRISGLLVTHKRVGAGIALFERGWLEEATARPGATFALLDTTEDVDHQRLVSTLQERFPDMDADLRKFVNEMRRNMDALRPVALGMGLAALLACAFLLTASFRMSLAERTRELAMLRAIGATPPQVRHMVLAEGLLLGFGGSLGGAALGVAGATLSSGGVASLLAVEPVPAVIPWVGIAVTTLAGTLLALLSALGVARAAARTDPLRAMRPDLSSQEQSARHGGLFGVILAVAGAAAMAVTPLMPKEPLEGGLVPLTASTGALAIALGLLLGTQRILPLLLPVLAFPFRRSPLGPVAVRGLLRHRRRSGLSVGAMGLGLILVISIFAFSTPLVNKWYEDARKQHPADIHLEAPMVFHRGVAPDLARKVAAIPGVTVVGTVTDDAMGVLVDYDWSKADPAYVRAMDDFEHRYPSKYFRQRDGMWMNSADLPALVQIGSYRVVDGGLAGWGEGAIALQKSYAEQLGVKVGDRLRLNVKQGSLKEAAESPEIREFTVVALLETDSWRMPRTLIAKPLPGATDRLRMVYANVAPERLEAARQQARELIQSMEYNLMEYSDAETAIAELRTWTNQRFALVLAVGLIMAAVAVMSLINAVVNSVNERKREFALLRSVGATPIQVRDLVLLEAGMLGVVGGFVGVIGGAVLGIGALWGLEPDASITRIPLPWSIMAAGLALSLLLALLAATGPARRVMQQPPAEAVQAE